MLVLIFSSKLARLNFTPIAFVKGNVPIGIGNVWICKVAIVLEPTSVLVLLRLGVGCTVGNVKKVKWDRFLQILQVSRENVYVN